MVLVLGAVGTSFPLASASGKDVPTCFGYAATIMDAGVIAGTADRDVIVGSSGPDVIEARGGNDVICGLAGGDIIHGGLGNDMVDAGEGDDFIRGDVFSSAGDASGGAGGARWPVSLSGGPAARPFRVTCGPLMAAGGTDPLPMASLASRLARLARGPAARH